MHSPYMYDLLTKVLDSQKSYYKFEEIEAARLDYLQSEHLIRDLDLGAGSHKTGKTARTVAAIANSALSSPRKCQMLFRLVEHLRPRVIIELGSSLGISSAYLGAANPSGKVFCFEGNPDLLSYSQDLGRKLNLPNIEFIGGNFDSELPSKLKALKEVNLAFIDGNHRKIPTLLYYELLRKKCAQNAVIIMDDIRWSAEMFETWTEIIQDSEITASVDVFSFGILFYAPEFKKRLDLSIIPSRHRGGPIFR